MASSLPHYASKDVLYEEERDFISSGTFSQVFRGQLRNRPSSDSFAVIAVKVIENLDLLYSRAECLDLPFHEHIVKCLGVCAPRCALLLEYKEGDLSMLLNSDTRFVAFENLGNRIDVCRQIASGMAFLHSQGVLHLNLKPAKVLVERAQSATTLRCKITGLQCRFESEFQFPPVDLSWGTNYFMAPERLSGETLSAVELKKSDVYSFGIMMWLVLEKIRVENIASYFETDEARRFCMKFNFRGEKSCAPEWCNKLSFSCSERSFEDRPSFADVLERFGVNQPFQSDGNCSTSIERKELVYNEEKDIIDVGGFGEVYKAEFTRLKETVAVKVLYGRPRNEDEKRNLTKEAEVFSKIPPHLNIVKLIGICNEFRYFALVLEFAERGNLSDFLKSDKTNDWKTRENVAQQTAAGMKHLHTCEIIHLDLKPANVLIKETNGHVVAKICDFGLSKNKDVSLLTRSRQSGADPSGTVPYISPERYSEHPYGEGTDKDRPEIAMKSDVYSYGVILWRIQERRSLPTRKMPPGYYKYYKLPNRTQQAPKWYNDLVDKCDKEKPEERPLFSEIGIVFESQQ